ncbi:MAG: DUF4131 domain-containing protein [Coleofasciculus sp. S288]|nr:DUF4131 domain-containing protein [Coleofasciculus sp. S288]
MLNKHHDNRVGEYRNVRIGAIALALMAMLFPAFTANRVEAAPLSANKQNVTPEEVTENVNDLIGETVTVRGEVGQVIDDVTFTITDDEFFGGDEILVVNATGRPFSFPTDDAEIQVTGEVRQFKAFDFNRDFGLDLQPDTEYEERPTIVAQSMALAPDPGEITANPSLYYGQPIALEGEVEEIMGANAFTLDDDELLDGGNLLVLIPNPQQTISDGERVVVTGQVRPFVAAEIERDFDFTWDAGLQRQLETEYSNRPVFIADKVYTYTSDQ